jgi:hypothetical protein
MSVATIVITASVASRVRTIVLRTGAPGKSAYQSYLDTTDDDPALSEEQWSSPSSGGSQITISGGMASAEISGTPYYWPVFETDPNA